MLRIKKRTLIPKVLILLSCIYGIGYMMYVWGQTGLIASLSTYARHYNYVKFFFVLLLLFMYFIQCDFSMKVRIGFSSIIVLFGGYVLIRSFFTGTLNISTISEILIWPLLFLNMYTAKQHNDFDIQECSNIVYFSLILTCIFVFPMILTHLSGNGYSGMVVRPAYFCITYLPFVYCMKKTNLRKILIIVVSALIIMTTKRAGFIACFGFLIVYYVVKASMEGNIRDKINAYAKYIFFGLIAGIAIYAYVTISGSSILERFSALSEDGGSNRDVVWETIVYYFSQLDLEHKLFGMGHGAVSSNIVVISHSINAHNDLFEYLYDFGIVGVGLMVLLYGGLFTNAIKEARTHSDLAPNIAGTLFMMLVICMLSYGLIQSTTVNFIFIFWGYIFGDIYNRKYKSFSLYE